MLFRKIRSIQRRLYNFRLRRQGARITSRFNCSPGTVEGMPQGLCAAGSVVCENGVKLLIGLNNNGTPGKLEIGDKLYINRYSIIDCHCSVRIGNNVQIGPLCYITDFDHSVKVNADPAVHRSEKIYRPVLIGDNVWIGAGSMILKGVVIGANSVVGAGSVITKDIPENTIYAGNPQRLIRTL